MVTYQGTCNYKPVNRCSFTKTKINPFFVGIPAAIGDQGSRSGREIITTSRPYDNLLKIQSKVSQLPMMACWWKLCL